MRFNIGQKDILMDILQKDYGLCRETILNKISIDSKKVNKNDLFIAIKGERTDGHLYINDAIANGASIIVASKKTTVPAGIRLIVTKSTKNFIIDIATKYRKSFNVKMIAITGTNGKTTTKELLYQIVNKNFNTFKNRGNYNSTIGLPLSLLGIMSETEYGVIEIGASRIGEIDTLSKIVNPFIGLITNISIAHLETFKTFENIVRTKLELFDNIQKNGTAIKNFDDKSIKMSKHHRRQVSFSYKDSAQFQGSYKLKDGKYKVLINDNEFEIKNNGYSVVLNFLAVYTIANIIGISNKSIQESINSFEIPDSRGKIATKNGATIIDDSYNANYESMRLGIDWISRLEGYRKKIAIIGEMKELGDLSEKYHIGIGKIISETSITYVLCYGDKTTKIIENIKSDKIFKFHFKSKIDLTRYLESIIEFGDLIYVKGSRSNRLETIIKEISC